MIYYNSKSKDLIEAYLNLEELSCLSAVTGIPCSIIDNNNCSKYFNLSGFELVEKLPEDILKINISDYVCLFENDLDDMECMDFISYKSHQSVNLFRLDKFFNQDYEVYFNKPNYYESKYYTRNESLYKNAINSAFEFNLNDNTLSSLSFINKILPKQPLLIITPEVINMSFRFDFEDCYFYSESCTDSQIKSFFLKNNLKPFNIYDFCLNYHSSFKNTPIFIVLMAMADNFTDLYGPAGNYMFGAMCKQIIRHNPDYQIKLLNDLSGAAKRGFEVYKPQPFAFFEFEQMYLNYDRFEIMSLMRFKKHLKDWSS